MPRLVVLLAILLTGSSWSIAQTVTLPNHVVEIYASPPNVTLPTAMAFIGADDILLLQKADGQVIRVIGGVIQAGNVLDVAVNSSSERGLLGIAIDPDFINNSFVYLYYTEAAVDGGIPLGNRVYRYTWNGSALVAPQLVLDLPVTPGPDHDAGILLFGADDKLYTIIGDLNHNGALQNNGAGADPDDSSVILRTNVDGTAPTDNPFYSATNPLPALNRYYAYGVRNSFGMAVDPVTGALWDTENGAADYDEINRVDRGTNSGWNKIMGPDSRDPQGIEDLWAAPGSLYSDPEFSWNLTIAPTSIAFIGSPKLGCANLHDVIVGDTNCGQLYHFEPNVTRDGFDFTSPALADLVADNTVNYCADEQSEIVFGSGFNVVTDIETGPDGLLYVLSISTGEIYRIVPALPALDDPDGDGVDSACDCSRSNATAYSLPFEIPRLRLSAKAPTHLGWDSQNAATGSGTTYTVVSGTLSALRADAGFASACTLASGLTATKLDDARMPGGGAGFYYLARASNACGNGTFGDSGESPDPRDLLDAALPAACP